MARRPFSSAVLGTVARPFRPSSLPVRAPAELSCVRRSGCESHAAGRRAFLPLFPPPNPGLQDRKATTVGGHRASRKGSASGCACTARMLPEHTEAARCPAPACALPGPQLGPLLPHPHPRDWRWRGSLARAVAGRPSLGVRQGLSERSCIVGREQHEGSPATPRRWRTTGRGDTFGNLESRGSRLKCLPAPTARPAVPPKQLRGPLGTQECDNHPRGLHQ